MLKIQGELATYEIHHFTRENEDFLANHFGDGWYAIEADEYYGSVDPMRGAHGPFKTWMGALEMVGGRELGEPV